MTTASKLAAFAVAAAAAFALGFGAGGVAGPFDGSRDTPVVDRHTTSDDGMEHE